jgi:uncharacterized membrane protein
LLFKRWEVIHMEEAERRRERTVVSLIIAIVGWSVGFVGFVVYLVDVDPIRALYGLVVFFGCSLVAMVRGLSRRGNTSWDRIALILSVIGLLTSVVMVHYWFRAVEAIIGSLGVIWNDHPSPH